LDRLLKLTIATTTAMMERILTENRIYKDANSSRTILVETVVDIIVTLD